MLLTQVHAYCVELFSISDNLDLSRKVLKMSISKEMITIHDAKCSLHLFILFKDTCFSNLLLFITPYWGWRMVKQDFEKLRYQHFSLQNQDFLSVQIVRPRY